MIADKISRLALYDGVIPGAARLAAALGKENFDPDDAQTHDGFVIRHKQYKTKPDESRRFEVHEHTIDLMLCLAGSEIVHVTDDPALARAEALQDDGWKLDGAPRGTAVLLKAGEFIAIFPGEAHMVAGRPDNAETALEKLVCKLPMEKNDACPCRSDCVRHGDCRLCVRWHHNPKNSLPTCLRQKGRDIARKAAEKALGKGDGI